MTYPAAETSLLLTRYALASLDASLSLPPRLQQHAFRLSRERLAETAPAGSASAPGCDFFTHSENSSVWVIVSPTLTAKSGSIGQMQSLIEYPKRSCEYVKSSSEYSL